MSEVGGVDDERDGSQGVSPEVRVFVMDIFEEGGGDNVDGGLFFHLFDADIDYSSECVVLAL